VTLIKMSFIPTFMEVGLVEYENYAKEFKCFEMEVFRVQ
jgi:hypothetical protein